jgi:hypothetical protein
MVAGEACGQPDECWLSAPVKKTMKSADLKIDSPEG